ncbi:hypothetical protein [Halothiobacillus diazotrophicus]|nr:hypothetical protein [Halothiobacillus diazotrophicus]
MIIPTIHELEGQFAIALMHNRELISGKQLVGVRHQDVKRKFWVVLMT